MFLRGIELLSIQTNNIIVSIIFFINNYSRVFRKYKCIFDGFRQAPLQIRTSANGIFQSVKCSCQLLACHIQKKKYVSSTNGPNDNMNDYVLCIQFNVLHCPDSTFQQSHILYKRLHFTYTQTPL